MDGSQDAAVLGLWKGLVLPFLPSSLSLPAAVQGQEAEVARFLNSGAPREFWRWAMSAQGSWDLAFSMKGSGGECPMR